MSFGLLHLQHPELVALAGDLRHPQRLLRHRRGVLHLELHPVGVLAVAAGFQVLRVVGVVVDGRERAEFLEALDEQPLPVEVGEAQGAVHGRQPVLARPVLDGLHQGPADRLVVDEVDPAEAGVAVLPLLDVAPVDDPGDPPDRARRPGRPASSGPRSTRTRGSCRAAGCSARRIRGRGPSTGCPGRAGRGSGRTASAPGRSRLPESRSPSSLPASAEQPEGCYHGHFSKSRSAPRGGLAVAAFFCATFGRMNLTFPVAGFRPAPTGEVRGRPRSRQRPRGAEVRLNAAVGAALAAGVAATAWTALTLAEFGHFARRRAAPRLPGGGRGRLRAALAAGGVGREPPAATAQDLLAVGLACATLFSPSRRTRSSSAARTRASTSTSPPRWPARAR